MTKIVAGVLERNGVPGAVAGLVIGGKDVGEAVVESQDVDLGKYNCIFRELCPDAPSQYHLLEANRLVDK